MKLDTPLDPVNRTAALVVGAGVRHVMFGSYPNGHWETCPPLIPRKEWCPYMQDLTGHKVGRLTVVGFAQLKGGNKTCGRWAVRCACGDFEIRRAKSIKNPNNRDDMCHICRKAQLTKRFRDALAAGHIK